MYHQDLVLNKKILNSKRMKICIKIPLFGEDRNKSIKNKEWIFFMEYKTLSIKGTILTRCSIRTVLRKNINRP